MGEKIWKEFLGFNIPEVIDCKEILNFRNKHKCSFSINMYGIMFIYNEENVYKVEIYKNKICISKNKI